VKPTRVTRHDLAASALSRWKAQYRRGDPAWAGHVRAALADLGKSPDPDEVDRVIGNGSWTDITCSNCAESVTEAVLMAGVANDEYGPSSFCAGCLSKALGAVT
jgi:hypothetical protein